MPSAAQPLDGNYKPITAIVGTPVTASATSSTPASVASVATLQGVAGQTTYLNGFICTSAIPGANVVPLVTVTGCQGGTLSFQFPETTAFGGQLIIFFPMPIPASAQNTSIAVTIPALASSGNSAVVAYGFQL